MLEVAVYKQFKGFELAVEFTHQAGVLGFLGASGSGKSLTLKMIAGIEQPDRGRICLNGRVLYDSELGINLPPQARRVGYLFQHDALFPNMTVVQNLRVATRDQDQINAMLAMIGLNSHEDRYPAQLSGGQRQRVALARVLLSQPDLLLLDEPFSALDNHLTWQIERELFDLIDASGLPTIFVSHKRDEIYRNSPTILTIDRGQIGSKTPRERFFQAPQTVAEAQLTGCKNYSRFIREQAHQGYAVDWDVTLTTVLPIPEQVTHVGYRSHFVLATTAQQPLVNALEGQIDQVIPDLFSTIYIMRVGSSSLIVESAHHLGQVGQTVTVGLDPTQILLLTESKEKDEEHDD